MEKIHKNDISNYYYYYYYYYWILVVIATIYGLEGPGLISREE
jgi:hypothetical protein